MPQKLRDKCMFPQSPTTTYREREPTSPDIANRGLTNMTIDFSRQQSVVPNSLGGSTKYPSTDPGMRTMNASGRPKALNVMVGGAGEARAGNKGPGMHRQQLSPQKGR